MKNTLENVNVLFINPGSNNKTYNIAKRKKNNNFFFS